ncbi:hypothetical protein OL229_10420 [Neisseriaceae bacterium JH1-16]|nr:hypothetical protein [Neisseriaceae bacterium JH1-16]
MKFIVEFQHKVTGNLMTFVAVGAINDDDAEIDGRHQLVRIGERQVDYLWPRVQEISCFEGGVTEQDEGSRSKPELAANSVVACL